MWTSFKLRVGCGRKGTVALLLSVVCTNSLAVTKTYVLDNSGGSTQYSSGPTGNGYINLNYPSGPTVIFNRSATLAPAHVVLKWDNNHGGAKNSNGAYCTRSSNGTGNGFSVESGFVYFTTYNGVDLFKTNIQGLYFSVNLHNLSAAGQFTFNVTELNIRNGIQYEALTPIPTNSTWCDATSTTDKVEYTTYGGVGFYSTITFYTDQNYTPPPSGTALQLLSQGGYHFRLWNRNPGPGIASYYTNVNYDLSALKVSEPTCLGLITVTGAAVNKGIVDLGSYSPNEIINGAKQVPFSLQLTGCQGLNTIDVTLTSNSVATDPTLLGNALANNRANGVGLQISGAANNHSPQTILVPNNATSVYHNQNDTLNDNNIYGINEPGVSQSNTLNFLAMLKQDSNQPITAGNFRATGIFTMDYK